MQKEQINFSLAKAESVARENRNDRARMEQRKNDVTRKGNSEKIGGYEKNGERENV